MVWHRHPITVHAIGQRIGLVVVIARAPTLGKGQRWRVRCVCGAERIMLGSTLRQTPPKTHVRCKP